MRAVYVRKAAWLDFGPIAARDVIVTMAPFTPEEQADLDAQDVTPGFHRSAESEFSAESIAKLKERGDLRWQDGGTTLHIIEGA